MAREKKNPHAAKKISPAIDFVLDEENDGEESNPFQPRCSAPDVSYRQVHLFSQTPSRQQWISSHYISRFTSMINWAEDQISRWRSRKIEEYVTNHVGPTIAYTLIFRNVNCLGPSEFDSIELDTD